MQRRNFFKSLFGLMFGLTGCQFNVKKQFDVKCESPFLPTWMDIRSAKLDDAYKQHEAELTATLAEEINFEIDREILADLHKNTLSLFRCDNEFCGQAWHVVASDQVQAKALLAEHFHGPEYINGDEWKEFKSIDVVTIFFEKCVVKLNAYEWCKKNGIGVIYPVDCRLSKYATQMAH